MPAQLKEIICPILIEDEAVVHKIHLPRIPPLEDSSADEQETNNSVTVGKRKP